MNASGRRCRQFKNGFKHLALICGKHVKGGRPIRIARVHLSIAAAIQKEREFARRQAMMKGKKK